MIKNRNLITICRLVVKRQFSQSSKIQGPSVLKSVLKNQFYQKYENIDNNSPKKDIMQKQMVDYIDAKKSIKSDLAKIEPAKQAVEKMSDNITPSKKEFTCYSDLKNQYEDHLGSDSDSDMGSESNSGEGVVQSSKQSQHEKLNDLKTYLEGEYVSTDKSLNWFKNKFFKVFGKENEAKKRKMEESSDIDSSIVSGQDKKSRSSVHDFVENLPTDYNPLDDIGTD